MEQLTDKNYVDLAEKAIKALKKNHKDEYYLTMTNLRNLQALTSSLFDELGYRKYEELQDKVSYLRVQFVYQAGRIEVQSSEAKWKKEYPVRDLVDKANILEHLKGIKDGESLARFCRYMEALIAYFKYYGGKEK